MPENMEEVDGFNATFHNGTTGASPSDKSLLTLDFLFLELRLVCSAVGIIFLGAHAALRRPPSAARRSAQKPGKKQRGGDDDDDADAMVQGLLPSDAILFPLMAAAMLVGLYYLIQWLKDPEILNKILRYYMTTVSIVSMVTFYAHGIDLITSFVFPEYWRGRDGKVRSVNQSLTNVAICDAVGNPVAGLTPETSPFPGLLSAFGGGSAIWKLRSLLTQYAHLKIFAIRVGEERIRLRFSHLGALLLSALTAGVYFATTSPLLSNILGYGMCYGSFLLLSPTDLLTSSLVLSGLFVYDIVMVFYTPYMITVATTLDVPIKLQFKTTSRQSMLGLGDIVIPGMVIAWALRLDLWLYYANRVKYESKSVELVLKEKDGTVVRKNDTKHVEVKPPYVNAKGKWGERLWLRSAFFLSRPVSLPPAVEATGFPKTYFFATMVGYLSGMMVTLAMLFVFERGQPALLYLVPGVLGSIYSTALLRGELSTIWSYTEDGSLDKMDVVVELDARGKALKSLGLLKDGVVDTTTTTITKTDGEEESKGSKQAQNKSENEQKRETDAKKAAKSDPRLFSISLELPAQEEP